MPKITNTSTATLPTAYYGEFKIKAYKTDDNIEHLALVKGDIKGKDDVLLRIHSECLTGDVLHSARCDCGQQLESALKMIDKKGEGALIYLRQEGRGIGLFNKIKAYNLQEQGMDTVEANVELGFKADERDYEIGAQIIKDLGPKSIQLITNNPEKIDDLKKHGINISGRVPIIIKSNKHNEKYLNTKKQKLGHLR